MKATAYYNEIEHYPAQWLRNLSAAGHIAPGFVDERSIAEVTQEIVNAFPQAHFFAGIGGWSHALRLAGWPDDRPVWTGSCPCQPFSQAGAGGGFDDPRHLWPVWFPLIRECRPPVVFGEQVASKAGLAWLDLVRVDLEGAGYTFAAADLCAAGIGAPHIRQRLYWTAIRLADDDDARWRVERRAGLCADGNAPLGHDLDRRGAPCRMGDDDDEGPQGHGESGGVVGAQGRQAARRHDPEAGFWEPCDWIDCLDGKRRPVEPGSFPLAHGVPGRVGRLRAYGNAIVPQVAATFVRAVMDEG